MSMIKIVSAALDTGELPAVDIFAQRWEKIAGMHIYMPPEIDQFMKTAKPIEGKRLLLVHGLGSEEAWGANANGDGFAEKDAGEKSLLEDDPSKEYGYKTFEKHAHTFRDHKNHDPKYSIGGKVVLAAWNDKMRRVELIIPVDEKLAGDVVAKIDANEPVACSMGAKVAHDVCAICGNKAKHRGEYCKHAKYEMNHVYEDGSKAFVHNPKPKFFDISIVNRPADRSAYSLAKVASQIEQADASANLARVFKIGFDAKAAKNSEAEMKKEIPAVGKEVDTKAMFKLISSLVPFDLEHLPGLSKNSQLALDRADPETIIPTTMAAGILLQSHELPEDFGQTKMGQARFSPELFNALREDMPSRSLWLSYFGDRCFRNLKYAADAAQVWAPSDREIQYLSLVKAAFEGPKSREAFLNLVWNNASIRESVYRNATLELNEKLAAHQKGLSAQNLIAAMLGPMMLSAYFRGKQQIDPSSVGALKGFVADHPLASGAATALLWHKLKGGAIPGLA